MYLPHPQIKAYRIVECHRMKLNSSYKSTSLRISREIMMFMNLPHCTMFLFLFSWLQQRQRTAEVKIVLIFSYFMAYLVMLHIRIAVFVAEFESFQSATNSYFVCEAVGYVPGRCSRESFEQYSHPIIQISLYILTLLLPTTNLLFIINCRVLREKVAKLKIIQSLQSLKSSSSRVTE